MLATLIRLALILIGLLLLMAALVLVLLKTPMAASLVEDRLRAWLHPGLQIQGPVQVTVFPAPGVDLRDIVIDSEQGSQTTVSVKQVQLQIEWLALLDRQLHVQEFYVDGVKLVRAGPTSAASVSEPSQATTSAAIALRDWATRFSGNFEGWQLVLDQALIEDLTVFGDTSSGNQVPLLSLQQLQLQGSFSVPLKAGDKASLSARSLSVHDAEEFGHASALLEQLGIASNGTWDLIAMDSEWVVGQTGQDGAGLLRLPSLTANGSWGEVTASDGRIDLDTGQIAVPVQALFTNAPKFKSRALEINVRQSRMRFELIGTVTEPGVQWLNPLR